MRVKDLDQCISHSAQHASADRSVKVFDQVCNSSQPYSGFAAACMTNAKCDQAYGQNRERHYTLNKKERSTWMVS